MSLAGVIFDFDGLVLDTEYVEYVSIDSIFRAHGTTLSLDLWKTFIGSTDHEHWSDILARQIGRSVDRETLAAQRVIDNRPALDALEVNKGVVELLDELRDAGVPLAVASSSPREWVEGHLGRVGLLDRFVAVRTGDEVAVTKPSPDVYLLATGSLGVDPARTVAIEDSHNGCVAAKAAGLVVVGVPNHMTDTMDFSTADLVVGSVADLDVAALDALVP